jgi:WD40 repeat protein
MSSTNHPPTAGAVLAALFLLCLGTVALGSVPHIVAPNGAERFKVGSTTTIRWDGTAPADTVKLEYSTDDGASWKLITDKATGLQYTWSGIPNTPSDFCLMRVTSSGSTGDSVLWLKRIQDGFVIPDAVHYAEFSPDGSRVIGGEPEGDVVIWDSFTGQILLTVPVESRASFPAGGITLISSARFSPDGALFATISPIPNKYGATVRIFDATTGAKLREWQRVDGTGGMSSASCAFSPDGTRLVVTGLDGGIVYNVADGSIVAQLQGYTGPLNRSSMIYADWRADGAAIIGSAFATPGIIPSFILSDPVSGNVLKTYDYTPPSTNTAVQFSPDGGRFISTSDDGLARIWDAASGTILNTINGFDRYPNWADYARDGNSFVLAGQDNATLNWKLRLYDANGTFIRTIAAIGNGMQNADFSPDGSRVLVSCIDGVRIFHAPETDPGGSDVSDAVWSIYLEPGTVIISAPKVAARQGEIVTVPITIDAPAEAIGAGASRIDVSLRYNVSLLDPIDGAPRGSFTDHERTIPLSFPLTSPTDTILGVLRFRAALGDDSLTSLSLISPSSDAPAVTVLSNDGSFTLLDLCREGGARLVNPNGAVSLKIISPSPASTFVDVEGVTIEQGRTTVSVVDMNGRTVKRCLETDAPQERWSRRIDLDDLSSGRYFLVLRTPTVMKSVPMEVKR